MATATSETIRAVRIPAGRVMLQGDLIVPTRTRARGVVLFAHGSGSSRHSLATVLSLKSCVRARWRRFS